MDFNNIKDITPEIKEKIHKFQTRIIAKYGPKEGENVQIYRFLKARNFDLSKAEIMLQNHIEWRSTVNKVLETFKMNEIHAKHMRLNLISFTKDGLPVVFVDSGNIDLKGLTKSVKANDLLHGVISDVLDIEKYFEIQSKKLGKNISQWCWIFNFQNLQISQVLYKPCVDIILRSCSMYEANFPERLHTCFVINAPIVFYYIFNIIKPILPETILSKIKIYAKEGNWKEDLLNLIDADDLPLFLGGTKIGSNGDPFCDIVKAQGPVPKEHYFRHPNRRLRGKEHVKEYIIKPKEKCDTKFDIDEIGDEVFWSFESENYDISYGLFYCNNIGVEEVISIIKVNSHTEMEEGSHICAKQGTYILTFDNTHSLFREKHIFCKIFIGKSNGEELIITS